MYIRAALGVGERALIKSSTSPRLDAEVLLAHTLNTDRSALLASISDKITLWQNFRFGWLLLQRWRRMPIAYLTHEKEFYGHTFYVDKHVLIPRPDTELLVEESLRAIRTPVRRSFSEGGNGSLDTIIDIGTGSGCIATTLALELPHIKVIAIDISQAALSVAQKNATLHNVADRITFLRGNLLEPLLATDSSLLANSLLVTNLPYLLPNEVIGDITHEPQSALVGGSDGLKLYRGLVGQILALPPADRPSTVLLELHPPTALEVQKIFSPIGTCEIIVDTANLPRVLIVSTR